MIEDWEAEVHQTVLLSALSESLKKKKKTGELYLRLRGAASAFNGNAVVGYHANWSYSFFCSTKSGRGWEIMPWDICLLLGRSCFVGTVDVTKISYFNFCTVRGENSKGVWWEDEVVDKWDSPLPYLCILWQIKIVPSSIAPWCQKEGVPISYIVRWLGWWF